jgi:hypothetical protein
LRNVKHSGGYSIRTVKKACTLKGIIPNDQPGADKFKSNEREEGPVLKNEI